MKFIFIALTAISPIFAQVPTYQPGQVRNAESQFYIPPQQTFKQPTFNRPTFNHNQAVVTPTYQRLDQSKFKLDAAQKDNEYRRADTGKPLDKKDYVFRDLKNSSEFDAIAFKKGEKKEESPLTKSSIMPKRK